MPPSGSLKGDALFNLVYEIRGTNSNENEETLSHGEKSGRNEEKKSIEIWAMTAAAAPLPGRAGERDELARVEVAAARTVADGCVPHIDGGAG